MEKGKSPDIYKILLNFTLTFRMANRLKSNLDSIISETQSVFFKGPSYIRFVFDLLDYADSLK